MKMVDDSISDVHEANLYYLTSAKKLATEDRNEAIKQFGFTENTAEILECLSFLQVVHLAQINVLLSQVAFDDHLIGQILAGRKVCPQADHSVDAFGPKS
jgi:hypothetical protein